MKKTLSFMAIGVMCLCSITAMADGGNAGLLVVVHGSPSPSWNKPMTQLQNGIDDYIKNHETPFTSSKVVNLEFKEPSVAQGVKELIADGCKKIVAMPLFITHSSHVIFDIPAVLGQYASKSILEVLKEEGAEIAPDTVPIVMGPTLSEGDLLLKSAVQRVKEISTNPQDEAVVILLHGDHGVQGTWENLARRTSNYVCAKTGIEYADWSFVEVGQSYATQGYPAISQAADCKKRVLVIGLYVSLSPKRMHDRVIKHSAKYMENAFKKMDVVFAERAFLPDPNIVEWLVETAQSITTKE